MTLVASTLVDGVRPLGVESQPVIEHYRQLDSVIRSRLGDRHANLLARPQRLAATRIDWHSDVAGEVRPLAQLSPQRQGSVEFELAGMAAAIADLGAELAATPGSGERFGEILRRAMVAPSRDCVYLVGDQPVLVLWGFEPDGPGVPYAPALLRLGAAPPPPPAPVPVPRPAIPAAPAVAGAEVASLAVGLRTWTAWWRWLLPLLLLALLAFLLLRACEPLPPRVVEQPETPPDLAADIARAAADSEALSREADALRRRRDQQVSACAVPAPLPPPLQPAETPPQPVEATVPPPAEPPPVAVAPAAPPQVAALPKLPDLPALPPVPTVPKPVAAAPPAAAPPAAGRPAAGPSCVPQRRPEDAPEMVLVVDASGSMSEPIPGAASRLDAAKRSVSDLLDGLPQDIDVGLIEFSDCSRVHRDDFYRPSQRGLLKQRVFGLQALQGTPLGLSLERAGRIISSRRPGVIVVVSDGTDTCHGDPCGAARQIAAMKPNVRINVIDISGAEGNPSAQCMAQATGGRVYKPSSVGEMRSMIHHASGQPDIRQCQ